MKITLGPYGLPFSPWRPRDGRVFGRFAYDTETTAIDDERPYLTPAFVLGAACDGSKGVFLNRDNVLPFFQAHRDVPFVMHNASFDLAVTDALVQREIDLYGAVDRGLVWDTMILERLRSLAVDGHTARRGAGLADCVQRHLGVALDKGAVDSRNATVRTGFGRFLGKPESEIPAEHLAYLGRDVIATWHLFGKLNEAIRGILRASVGVYGHGGEAWLKGVVAKFGPLTHHVQLRASILVDVLRRNGIGIDRARREEKAAAVAQVMNACTERLRRRGYLPGEKGCDKALQAILGRAVRSSGVELDRTPTGKWSAKEEDLAELAGADDFVRDYLTYNAARKLHSTYLKKMGPDRLHPKFGYLLTTGRTSCGGGFNLQNLPREKGEADVANTIRGCFVPGEGNVFIDIDFSQIELVVLGYVMKKQSGLPSVLADLVNGGQDVHRLIAGTMLGKEPGAVTKEERNSVKPVSFGRPGGMGIGGLRKVAKGGYGIDLTDGEVQDRIDAYHRLCPELDTFLKDEVDSGLVIAEALRMTPAQYRRATGRGRGWGTGEDHRPAGWLGGMLLKVVKEGQPVTRSGRPYTPEEIDYFWSAAERLTIPLGEKAASMMRRRQAGLGLCEAVRKWAGRRPTFTYTGRLRAGTTFCSSRNTLFQGVAADGCILALWRVWRAGYKIVDFVHDQLVVESPADGLVGERVADIEGLSRQGMLEVIPGMEVKVETVVTRSLNKDDLDPRYA